MVLILGAGLAGLSAAWHLRGRDVLVLERQHEVGGLCRSFREAGFTFDHPEWTEAAADLVATARRQRA